MVGLTDEQKAALTPEQRRWVGHADGPCVGACADDIRHLGEALADARLEVARLTEERDEMNNLALVHKGHVVTVWPQGIQCESCRQNPPWNERGVAEARRLVTESDQQREDIRRLMGALQWVMTGYDLPTLEEAHDFDWVGWADRTKPLLAEMQERLEGK